MKALDRVGRFHLLLAATLAITWIGLRIVGGREQVSALSGTSPATAGAQILGLFYVLIHVATVGLAPILVIAAGLRAIVARWASPPDETAGNDPVARTPEESAP